MKQKITYSMNKNCVYCGNLSFGQWHIECIRLFTHLSTKGLTYEEIIELIKEKWDQSINLLYVELKSETKEEIVDNPIQQLIDEMNTE